MSSKYKYKDLMLTSKAQGEQTHSQPLTSRQVYIIDRIELKLLCTKTFGGGAVLHYYEPIKKTKTISNIGKMLFGNY